jgi:adenosylmethionine-8-amino-7-oxononanoate aminotransferase
MARGLLVRPLGNTIYLMPPYCSTAGEIEAAYQGIEAVADVITAGK